jgi:predicted RNA binding protein YcfA (HicA-like mRNA interferase family)
VGKIPVLKAREAVALLERLGFREVRQRGPTSSFVIQMDV